MHWDLLLILLMCLDVLQSVWCLDVSAVDVSCCFWGLLMPCPASTWFSGPLMCFCSCRVFVFSDVYWCSCPLVFGGLFVSWVFVFWRLFSSVVVSLMFYVRLVRVVSGYLFLADPQFSLLVACPPVIFVMCFSLVHLFQTLFPGPSRRFLLNKVSFCLQPSSALWSYFLLKRDDIILSHWRIDVPGVPTIAFSASNCKQELRN